jgi:hypothetical protein
MEVDAGTDNIGPSKEQVSGLQHPTTFNVLWRND